MLIRVMSDTLFRPVVEFHYLRHRCSCASRCASLRVVVVVSVFRSEVVEWRILVPFGGDQRLHHNRRRVGEQNFSGFSLSALHRSHIFSISVEPQLHLRRNILSVEKAVFGISHKFCHLVIAADDDIALLEIESIVWSVVCLVASQIFCGRDLSSSGVFARSRKGCILGNLFSIGE